MNVSRSLIAPRTPETPARRFEHYEAAMRAVADYRVMLCEGAARMRSNGRRVTDQDQPEDVFCLTPPHADHPPLAIIGGMGPLAGVLAFRRACARFKNSRAIVLYQACSVPDRSALILGEGQPDTAVCREMASRLANAVRLAVNLAPPAREPTRCIIACNSAHYFWPLVLDDLRVSAARACDVQMISMVDCSLSALKVQRSQRALLLTTEGAQFGAVFSKPCSAAGIAFDEPSPALSRLLMRVIFEGAKSLDTHRAVELGNEFFEAILQSGRGYDCVLAGCTELPLTINLLKLRGSPAVIALLSRVKIVDPLDEALGHA